MHFLKHSLKKQQKKNSRAAGQSEQPCRTKQRTAQSCDGESKVNRHCVVGLVAAGAAAVSALGGGRSDARGSLLNRSVSDDALSKLLLGLDETCTGRPIQTMYLSTQEDRAILLLLLQQQQLLLLLLILRRTENTHNLGK